MSFNNDPSMIAPSPWLALLRLDTPLPENQLAFFPSCTPENLKKILYIGFLLGFLAIKISENCIAFSLCIYCTCIHKYTQPADNLHGTGISDVPVHGP